MFAHQAPTKMQASIFEEKKVRPWKSGPLFFKRNEKETKGNLQLLFSFQISPKGKGVRCAQPKLRRVVLQPTMSPIFF